MLVTLEVDLAAVCTRKFSSFSMEFDDSTVSCHIIYRVYKKKRNFGISQEIDIVLKTKDFRRLGI